MCNIIFRRCHFASYIRNSCNLPTLYRFITSSSPDSTFGLAFLLFFYTTHLKKSPIQAYPSKTTHDILKNALFSYFSSIRSIFCTFYFPPTFGFNPKTHSLGEIAHRAHFSCQIAARISKFLNSRWISREISKRSDPRKNPQIRFCAPKCSREYCLSWFSNSFAKKN